jgi:hypothetical protein
MMFEKLRHKGKTAARRKEATVTLLRHSQLTAIGYGKNFANVRCTPDSGHSSVH